MTDERTPTTAAADDALVPYSRRAGGGSLLERWVERDPETAIKRVDTMVKVLEQVRAASIRATYPPDWVIHTSIDRASGAVTKQVGYLQDSGAERAGKVWGIELGAPLIERQDFPDGTFMVTMAAEAYSKLTGERAEVVMGSRWSGDGFFQRTGRDGEPEKIDPTDVQKAAYANLHGRAVRALAGLNAVPLEMLRQNGIDVERVMFVGYEKGAKGGTSTGAGVGSAEVVVAFGRSAGKRPGELSDGDLDWYIKAYGENVADPAKKRFVRANQQVLDGLTAEKERRAQAAAHGAATPAAESAPPPTGDVAGEGATAAGKLRGDVWARLVDAGGNQAIPLLERLTAELFNQGTTKMSELTEHQLAALAQIPEAQLRDVAKRVVADAKAK